MMWTLGDLRDSSSMWREPASWRATRRARTKWMTMKISWHAKQRPRAMDEAMRKLICFAPRTESAKSLVALLRQIMVATDAAVAMVHVSTLAPNMTLMKRLDEFRNRGTTFADSIHPMMAKRMLSKMEDRTDDVRTGETWAMWAASTTWMTTMVMVAISASAPAATGIARGRPMVKWLTV